MKTNQLQHNMETHRHAAAFLRELADREDRRADRIQDKLMGPLLLPSSLSEWMRDGKPLGPPSAQDNAVLRADLAALDGEEVTP